MAWARIEDERVVEITVVNPEGRYHPGLIWVSCSDAVVGMRFFEGRFFSEIKSLPSHVEIESLRLLAYADAVSGSDRYFAEALRLQAMGASENEIETVRAAGLGRYAEIQAAYPWPVG